jgi:hypothetical protein
MTKTKKITLLLKDKRAIDIINSLPRDKLDEIIEKYIILGNMVISCASVSTAEETVEDFFRPLQEDLETLRKQLTLIVPTVAKPAKKGEITVEHIYKSLGEYFMDDDFEDISKIGKYTDIKAKPKDINQEVLIEVKDYTTPVPSDEVDKFWRDMELRNMRYGVFISLRTDITKTCDCIKVVPRLNKTAVFVVNERIGMRGHIIAYYIIRKIIEHENSMKKDLNIKETSEVVNKINISLKSIKNEIKFIDEIISIADGLKTLTNNRLEKIIQHSNKIKAKIDDDISDVFEEFKKLED